LSVWILSRNIYFDMICQSRMRPFVKTGTVTQYLFCQRRNRSAYSLDSVTQYLFGTQEYLYTKSEMLTTYRTGSVTQYQNCTSRITLYISGAHREDKTHSNLSRFALRFLSPRAGEPLTLFYNSSLKKINFLDFTWSSCSFLDS